MFRRRTDRVYSTLQNVQRRVTQATVHGDEIQRSHSVTSVTPIAGEDANITPVSDHPDGGQIVSVARGETNAPLIQPVRGALHDAPVVGDSALLGAPETVQPTPTIQPVHSQPPSTPPSTTPGGQSSYSNVPDGQSSIEGITPVSESPAPDRGAADGGVYRRPTGMTMFEDEPEVSHSSASASQSLPPRGLVLSYEVASVVVLGWLLTAVICFGLGWRMAPRW